MAFQQCIIQGNLGRDPELRYTPDGTPVCDFSVAVNNYKDEVTWFKVTVWRKQAETCNQYLRKGSAVLVVGEIAASAYIPRDGGDPRASLELTARDVRFLSGGREDGDSEQVPF